MSTVCFRCKMPGHYKRDCPMNRVCDICEQRGHATDQCPNYRPVPPRAEYIEPSLESVTKAGVFCDVCNVNVFGNFDSHLNGRRHRELENAQGSGLPMVAVPQNPPLSSGSQWAHHHSVTKWSCAVCTGESPVDAPRCVICDNRKGTTPAQHTASITGTVSNCAICLTNPSTYTFSPCGHTVICELCHQNLSNSNNWNKNCIVCRANVEQVFRAPEPVRALAPGRCPDSTFPWIGGDMSRKYIFLDEIRSAAREYLNREMGPSVRGEDCSGQTAVQRFIEGWKQHACPEGVWSGLFAWHGTPSASALQSICREGWDAKKRKRNNHGPGEYFAVHYSQVFDYLGHDNPSTMILSFILRGTHLTWVEDFCLVCNNPLDEPSVSYCLPVMKVTLSNSPERWNVPRFPYRWQFAWINDEEKDYIVYEQEVNYTLCEGMCRYYAKLCPSHITLEFPRASDHVTTLYTIDYQGYTQRNDETGFERKIIITCVPATKLPRTLWVMLVASEHWATVDLFAQQKLTEAYLDFHDSGKVQKKREKEIVISRKKYLFDVQYMRLQSPGGGERIPVALVDN